MNRVELLSDWTTQTQNGMTANVPRFGVDYAGKYAKWEDVTGTDSSRIVPNATQLVMLVECDDACLALLSNDPNYLILSSEVIIEAAL